MSGNAWKHIMFKTIFLAIGVLSLGTGAALAHITLETREAAVGANYKAVLRVPHGCDGKPTNVVRIKIPEGVIAVKPMPKPGWTLETTKGKYAGTYDNHGTPTSEGVLEVVWSGGSLSDEHYDEFVLRGMLTEGLPVGETLYFPVVQECGDVAERWIEVPAAGQDGHDLAFPAPGVKLLPKK